MLYIINILSVHHTSFVNVLFIYGDVNVIL